MLVSLNHIMGCGRSKSDSQNSIDEAKDHKFIKQKSGGIAKTEKTNKISDWKENEDPVRTANTKVGGGKREKSSRKQEEKVTTSPLKTKLSNANGNVPNTGISDADELTTDKNSAGKDEKITASKEKTPSLTSQTVQMTSSQIEFFRLLDEKIESGRDYLSHSESED